MNLKSWNLWKKVSVLTFGLGVGALFYFLLGLGYAEDVGLGAFDFLLWPSVILLAIGVSAQQVSVRLFRNQRPSVKENNG